MSLEAITDREKKLEATVDLLRCLNRARLRAIKDQSLANQATRLDQELDVLDQTRGYRRKTVWPQP